MSESHGETTLEQRLGARFGARGRLIIADNIYNNCYFISMPHVFDHEKLDVYRVELEFVAWTSELISEITRSAPH